jgi:AcrR family transcriptional regulator
MSEAAVTAVDIVNAARAVLDEEGLEGLTVRAVATAAGCSTMGIYTHFGSKEGLWDVLFLEAFAEFGEAVVAPGTGDWTVEQRLHAYREWALLHTPQYLLMFASRDGRYTPSDGARQRSQQVFEAFVHEVSASVGKGVLAGDPRWIATHLWASAHGYVMLELTGPGTLTPDAEAAYKAGIAAGLAPFRPADPGLSVGPGPR